MGDPVFAWEVLRTRIAENAVVCRGIVGTEVATTGSGPIAEDDFDAMLRRCGIEVFPPDQSDSEVLILGQDYWDPKDLDAALETHNGGHLRIYSQEMVLTSLMLGRDVFELCSEEELLEFADGHPALQYLSTPKFEWPSTEVSISEHQLVVDLAGGEWPETGVLKHMGYRVGRKGLGAAERRETLGRTLAVELIPGSVGADEYIAQWGAPGSPERLHKVANCLASFARNHKHIVTADYSKAIADWESDLEYLRTTQYRAAMGFQWPDTEVP